MVGRFLLVAAVTIVHTRTWQTHAFASLTPFATASFDKVNADDVNVIGTVAILIPSTNSDVALSKYGTKSPVGNPTIRDAATQLANKLYWFSEGAVTTTIVPVAAMDEQSSFQNLKNVDALIALGLTSVEDMDLARQLFESRTKPDLSIHQPHQRLCHMGLDCVGPLPVRVGPYKDDGTCWRSVIPWTAQASGRRLATQMRGLMERWSADDFAIALLLFFNQFSGSNIDWVKYSIDATWEKGPIRNFKELYSMVTECGDCITKCVADENCKKCLGELTALDTRDQVASYRTIVSFESELLKDFSYCILQKNNIFNCKAEIPTMPVVEPMASWRGAPLTVDVARSLLVGHLKDDAAPSGSLGLDISWKVACGANDAYDQFPSQNQIFYESVNGKDLWYDPIFRVETIDGRNVWCKRHYKVRNGPTAGTFRFSVLDNGITSNEFWTIVGVADDLSWIVFHYAGAATAVGQRYLGGLLCTPDGRLPPAEQLPEVWKAFSRAGIEPWELYVVDNSVNSAGALEAGPPPLTFYRDEVLALKAKKGAEVMVPS